MVEKILNKNMLIGYVYALFAVLFWSFNVVVARFFVNTLSPWQISFYRWFFAFIILFPFVIKKIYRDWDIILQNYKIIFWLSLSGIVLMNTFAYYAGKTISAVEMSLIGVMGPIFIVILSRIFLKEYLSKYQIFGIILSFFGVVVLILHGNLLNIFNLKLRVGDFYMLLLALSFAIYSIIDNFKPKNLSHIVLLSSTIFLGLIIIFPLFLYENYFYPMKGCSITTFLVLLGMGIFNSILAYLFWNIAILKIGNLKSSMIYYLMPVFSSLEAFFILGERLYLSQLYGGILIILGILLTNKRKS